MFTWRKRDSSLFSVPAVVLDHVVEFNDVFPFLVFLACLKSLFLQKGEKARWWWQQEEEEDWVLSLKQVIDFKKEG